MADRDALKAEVCAAVDEMAPRLLELSHTIHDNPELQFVEVKACGWITEFLRHEGMDVETGVHGMETAFIGKKRGGAPGPKVTFVAEYDALAEVGHACGHNILGTSNVGAAIALSRVMAGLAGEAFILGTPAEEGGGGKIPFVSAGVLDDMAAAITMHPQGGGGPHTVSGRCLAVLPLTVRYYGRTAHAAGNPEDGINALDALLHAFSGINALRQHVRPAVRIHGIIRHGGAAANVTPDYSEGEFLVRAPLKEEVEDVARRVKACMEAGAQAAGARVEIEDGPFYEDVRPNAPLTEAALANLRALGLPVRNADSGIGSYSTDLGNISRACPTVSLYMNIAGPGIHPHHRDFAAAAASPDGDAALLWSAKAMAMTAIDVLTDERLRDGAKADFDAAAGRG